MTMTADEVAALGEGLVSHMSAEQLRAAAVLYSTITSATTKENVIPIEVLPNVHEPPAAPHGHPGMPAGGALAGGSQQTGLANLERSTTNDRNKLSECLIVP